MMFFTKNRGQPASSRDTVQWDPAYPRAMAMACTQQSLTTGISSSTPSVDILPQVIQDTKSARCYITQLEWYETPSGRDVVVAQVGTRGSMWTDFVIELDSSPNPDASPTSHGFPLSMATILHMYTFNRRMLQSDRSAIATIHYVPPTQLSLPNFCRLLIVICQHGRQKVASGPAPSNWFALVLFHSMDALVLPEEEEQLAANHPRISYATEPISALVKQDVDAISQRFR
ncbi:hypothetical protein CALCODRAFT_84187 [Calocera cornea HHB12733]|uniref:Uncharacterized protein n=1 Tax=Calocera cornea HHB12733 TaxID=1353952 RepID=A0A165IM49_9BASI|nr:hypothetical protein CALCODRAFT_84187 [Calocera cornea HHB12733]